MQEDNNLREYFERRYYEGHFFERGDYAPRQPGNHIMDFELCWFLVVYTYQPIVYAPKAVGFL